MQLRVKPDPRTCAHTHVIQAWYQHGTSVVPAWYRRGTCVVPVWYPCTFTRQDASLLSTVPPHVYGVLGWQGGFTVEAVFIKPHKILCLPGCLFPAVPPTRARATQLRPGWRRWPAGPGPTLLLLTIRGGGGRLRDRVCPAGPAGCPRAHATQPPSDDAGGPHAAGYQGS